MAQSLLRGFPSSHGAMEELASVGTAGLQCHSGELPVYDQGDWQR